MIIRRFENEFEKDLERLAAAWGARGWSLEKSACRGKWSGTYDYLVNLGGIGKLFIGNGYEYAKSGVKMRIAEREFFNSHKDESEKTISDSLDDDGVESVILETYVEPDGYLCIWTNALLKMKNGCMVSYRETGLHYLLTGYNYSKEALKRKAKECVLIGS